MQTTTETFFQRAQADLRRISWRLMVSFDKVFDDDVTFFTLDQSLLDGPDVLASGDNDVVQEWDKYSYADYTDRVVSVEWSRQDELPSSVSLAMADMVLDNHDDFFTPGSGSAIDGNVLPRRPVRLYAGFGGEVVSVFVGLTEGMPRLDAKTKTARFHCIDFLDSIFNRPLDETVLLLDVRTNEVLDELFQNVGLLPAQYVLDDAINQIPIVFYEKGKKLGDAVRELMDAEAGRLYMDEIGIIRFKNRLAPTDASVYFFDGSNTIDHEGSQDDGIINAIEVKGKPRQVQEKQPVWQLAGVKTIAANSSIEIWAEFQDPVVTCDTPQLGSANGTSYVIVNESDSSSSPTVTSDIVISSPALFHRSYKFTVQNLNDFPVYVTVVELWATPAMVIDEVYVREQDDDSVAKYDERPFTIESDFIQSNEAARSLALSILHQYAEYGSTVNLSVKGTPALQLSDRVTVGVGANDIFHLTKIEGAIRDHQFVQRLRGTHITLLEFFKLDISILDGPDVLAP